jgi:hypothetical protein
MSLCDKISQNDDFANHPYLCKSLTKIKQQNQSNLALPVLVAGYLDYDILGE